MQSLQLALITGIAPDYTPLVTLIGTVVGEVVGYHVYSAKASKENSKDGITYELAMREYYGAVQEDSSNAVG